MSTNTKIYTAAEVASAGFSKEEINKALATITQKAHEEVKRGKTSYLYYGSNLDFLKAIARNLEELGYITKITEQSVYNGYMTIRWDTD